MTHPTRTRLSAEERELQILKAATRVFARSNYRVAGIAEIALEAGISEPAIYRYFPSKKDLFTRILKSIGKHTLDTWQRIVESEEADTLSALRRMVRMFVAGLRGWTDEVKVQFQALAESDDPDIARQLRDNNEAYVRFLARLIERGKTEGIVRSDVDAYAAGWLINGIGFTLSLVSLLELDRGVGERQVIEIVDGYLDSLTGARSAIRESGGAR